MYLDTIFSAADIQRQLPGESKKFFTVDASFKAVMKRTNEQPKAITAATVAGLREKFQAHNKALEEIQKNLEEYLETKRNAL